MIRIMIRNCRLRFEAVNAYPFILPFPRSRVTF